MLRLYRLLAVCLDAVLGLVFGPPLSPEELRRRADRWFF